MTGRMVKAQEEPASMPVFFIGSHLLKTYPFFYRLKSSMPEKDIAIRFTNHHLRTLLLPLFITYLEEGHGLQVPIRIARIARMKEKKLHFFR